MPDSAGPTLIDTSTRSEHEGDLLRGNRCAVLSGLSGELEPPHGQVGQGVPRRRLVLTNIEPGVDRTSVHTLSSTGSDTESVSEGEVEARPRGGKFQVHRDVQSADFLIRDLARRIGFLPAGGPLPRPLRVQMWSLMNFPLMWSAAETDPSTPVLDWLAGGPSGKFQIRWNSSEWLHCRRAELAFPVPKI